ncbi:hypothetical protein Tco_1113449 [Tanacetum coccineum]|uniref:Uncharacterized protein n=1 Tax=Tanacetum coccineum TaxID=301880 RepID=A0ABQ5ITE6_9ASTR
MAMLSVRVHKFEQKARRKIDFDKKESLGSIRRKFQMLQVSFKRPTLLMNAGQVDTLVDRTEHMEQFGDGAAKIYNLITGADTKEASTAGDAGEFALNGTGKVNITPARPQSVPTGKPNVPAPVSTGRQNRPIPVPTGRGDSPNRTSGMVASTQTYATFN